MANKPKLALIPSAYKASKVYSVLPNNGDGDFTFSRTGEATRVNKDGIIETVASNVPRLDYSDGSCPSLLLEPQRTNNVLYSQEFNSYWVKNACLTDDNYVISPSGELNACRLRDDNGGGTGSIIIYKGFVFNTNTEYTFSCFAKKDQVDFISLRTSSFDGTGNGNSFFNVANGTLGTIKTDHTAKIEDYGDGWYRCSITFAVTSGDVSGLLSIYANEQDNVLTSNRDGTTSVFIYGVQLEEGSYPTSYIKTTGSSVTRLADNCSLDTTGLGLTEITETFSDDTTNVITTIPSTYNVSNGKISKIIGI